MFLRLLASFVLLVVFATGAAAETDPKTLVERGWYRRAIPLLESRLASAPQDAEALVLLSEARQSVDDLKAAEALAERALVAAPQSAAAHWAMASVAGERAQNSGPVGQLGHARRFKKEAEAAAKLDPKHVLSRRALIQFHMMAPGVVGGDKKKAEALAGEIAAIDPVEGWLARAMLAGMKRDTAAAAQAFAKAHEADPSNTKAKLALAQWLATPWRGPVARVEKLALEAQTAEPQRIGSYVLLSALYSYLQRWSDLEAMLAKAVANVPDSRSAHYQSARQMIADGREFARAEALLREYLSRPAEGGSPGHAAARWRLGQALEKQGRKAEAIAEIERAVKADGSLEGAKKDLKRLRG